MVFQSMGLHNPASSVGKGNFFFLFQVWCRSFYVNATHKYNFHSNLVFNLYFQFRNKYNVGSQICFALDWELS
jgi:hypothetical protein